MKLLLFSLFFISNITFACITAPKQLKATEEFGFKIEIADSLTCDKCKEFRILAPKAFKNKSYHSSTYSIFENSDLISKTVQINQFENNNPEFIAAIRNDRYVFEVTFNYGNSRCSSYEFKYKS